MNASELTFGIEIETTIPTGLIPVGPYGAGYQVEWLPAGWKASGDSSIRVSPGRRACEFVSPVLKGADGIRQVLTVLRELNARGAKVNASCGLHVHVGFDASNRAALQRLITLAANFEKAIYATTGTKNRERGSYARGVQALGNAASVQDQARHDRYRAINLQNLLSGEQPTVEFRAFGGTLNATKIIGYVRMCLAIVERAIKAKRVTNWVAKTPVETSPIHRDGEGQTAVTRLFYQLGWTKGRRSYTYGDVTTEGAPTLAAVKKELRRLAKKYDAQP